MSDNSGNGNDGVLSGASWTTGKYGGALSFDGVDDFVSVANSTSLDITGTRVTLSAWVLMDEAPAADPRS